MSASEVYTSRLASRESDVAKIRNLERRISAFRLAAIALAIVLAALQLWWWALVPAAAFLALVITHERVVQRRERAGSAAGFYRRGLGRLTGHWTGQGIHGDRYRHDHHLYSNDLDLFGAGSVYELICTATTRSGQDLLAQWLASPAADVAEIVSRQGAVEELRNRLDLREELFVVGSEVKTTMDAARLEEWATGPEVEIAPWERIAALLLPVITTVILLFTAPPLITQFISATRPDAGIAPQHFPLWPIVIALTAQMLLARRLAGRIDPIVAGVERGEEPLGQLTRLLRVVEPQRFESERLKEIHQAIGSGTGSVSASIERLRRLVSLLDSRRNQFFAPFALLFLWSTNLGIAIERWRRSHRSDVLAALHGVAEVEALSSFGSFAFENPSFAMPELVSEGPLLEGSGVGHPLIPAERRVSNDVALGGTGTQLVVISGSNMSGKSTMLRSVGLAAVLAQAGAPVCATSLRLSPLAIGASITINDSIQEGSSRFYAEILRIRDVIELTRGERPVFFLLDEVLHGTNSHDRRIGAEGIVRKLVSAGAIGLVSTHDLALAELADQMAGAANMHFEDRIEDGRVTFDYRMRPGVVTHSNALELMRSVGIEV